MKNEKYNKSEDNNLALNNIQSLLCIFGALNIFLFLVLYCFAQ